MLTVALRQVLCVLQAAEDRGEAIGVTEIARRSGRSKGNVVDLLRRLRERGYVAHTGRYRPYRVARRIEPAYWIVDETTKELIPWKPAESSVMTA